MAGAEAEAGDGLESEAEAEDRRKSEAEGVPLTEMGIKPLCQRSQNTEFCCEIMERMYNIRIVPSFSHGLIGLCSAGSL